MPNQKEEAERRASPAEAARESQSGEEASRRRVVEMTARSRSHSSISDVSRSRSRSPHSPRRPADERSQAPLDAESSQRFPKRPPTSENKVLAVFGLHLEVTELELDGLYRPYGAKFCKIIWDKYVITSPMLQSFSLSLSFNNRFYYFVLFFLEEHVERIRIYLFR